MNHEKTHQTNPMAPWDPLITLIALIAFIALIVLIALITLIAPSPTATCLSVCLIIYLPVTQVTSARIQIQCRGPF